ncbi:MAG: UDP-N-acetylmuramoyl-L-alanyl-D-glutamate--2,6-diaminopimelate ligase, partial [Bacteroidales bacterium]|nr:UDP-N-acetylmuramoyl-L-alanyl-D-glutamate--2,6-diaminopimelate ligase [Bacteroidales bacterium]
MRLIDLLKDIETLDEIRCSGREISSVCTDSRKCTQGSLFIAVKGAEADGHKYIASA